MSTKFKFLPGFLITVLVLLLFGCSKDIPAIGSGKRLIEKIPGGSDSTGHMFFYYNSNNKLDLIKDTFERVAFTSYTYLEYDNQGRLVKTRDTFNINSFTYNNNNQIAKQEVFSSSGQFYQEIKYYYDSRSRLILDTTFTPGVFSDTTYIEFTYDDQDNIIQSKWHSNYNGNWYIGRIIDNCTYDNNPNIYKDLRALFFIDHDEIYLSRNNKLSDREDIQYTNTYKYTYGPNGLPEKVDINNGTYISYFIYN